MGNRISLGVVKKIKDGFLSFFHEIPSAKARQERAKATKDELEAFEQFVEFLKTVGYSAKDRKSLIAQILTSGSSEDNPVKNLQVISDLVERKRINFQITGEMDEPDDDDDDPQEELGTTT